MRACRRERGGGAVPGAAGAEGQSDHDAAPVWETELSVRRRDRAARVPGAVGEPVRAVGDGEPAARAGARGGGGAGPLPGGPRRAGSPSQRRGGGAPGSRSGPDPASAAVAGWSALVGLSAAVFTAPGYAVFTDLLAGWVLTPGRRTITRMVSVADPQGRRAHDAYHRFVRVGRWSMTALWRVLAVHAVAMFAPTGVVILDCDDTVYKKTGRKVNGTGTFRDAVRSTRARVVYAWGLNLVIITLRVTPPWGGCPLGFADQHAGAPQGRADHRGTGRPDDPRDRRLATRAGPALPRRRRLRHAGRRGPAAHRGDLPAASRRRALRTGSAAHRQTRTAPHQGRPVAHPTRTRRRGHRLGRGRHRQPRHHRGPPGVAPRRALVPRLPAAPGAPGRRARPHRRAARRLLHHLRRPGQPRRRPRRRRLRLRRALVDRGDQPRRQTSPRWRRPQSWKGQGPARAAALSLWLHTAIWCWYLGTHADTPSWRTRPWYRHKHTASFADALAALRRTLWRQRITAMSANPALHAKITSTLLDVLAEAA